MPIDLNSYKYLGNPLHLDSSKFENNYLLLSEIIQVVENEEHNKITLSLKETSVVKLYFEEPSVQLLVKKNGVLGNP